MRKEFFADKVFSTLEEAQEALDAWVVDYNTNREHQAIDGLLFLCLGLAVAFTPWHIYLALKHGWGYGRPFRDRSGAE